MEAKEPIILPIEARDGPRSTRPLGPTAEALVRGETVFMEYSPGARVQSLRKRGYRIHQICHVHEGIRGYAIWAEKPEDS